MTEKPTVEVTLDRGFQILCEQLKKHGVDAQRRVMNHLQAVTGRTIPLPVYHSDSSIPDNQKLELYKLCVRAVMSKDYSILSGQVAPHDPTETPVEPENIVTTTPETVEPVRRRRNKPVVPSTPAEDRSEYIKDTEPSAEDDPIQAAIKALTAAAAANSKPKLDVAAIRKIAHDVAQDVAHDWNSRLNIPDEDEIREIVSHALGNGAFPTARVQDIVDAAIKKAAPTLDLDAHIKPRINDLLAGTVKDLIAKGPAAITVAKATVTPDLASYQPDKDSMELKSYVISTGDERYLKDLDERAKSTNGVNLLLIGPKGCGKTTLAEWLAATTGRKLLIMDAANIREPRDWFGYKTVEAGEVKWVRSQFDLCLEAGNHVILIDEINRTTDQVRNVLLPLLDHRRRSFVQERGDYIRVGNNVIIMATANMGYEYTGTSALDAALDDRFVDRIEVSYLPMDKEAEVLVKRTGIDKTTALKLAEIADTIRKKALGHGATLTRTISTRQLAEAAKRFKTMGVTGLTYTLTNHFSAEGGDTSERKQVLIAVQGKFGGA